MTKRKTIICIAILSLALVAGVVIFSMSGRLNLLERPTNMIESRGCRGLAHKVLIAEKANYPFYRCEEKSFHTADNNKSIRRVYVVAGEVERQWEFECGFTAACSTYIGWFDEKNKPIKFTDPPQVANHDPAVYTLGCGEASSSSEGDIEITPQLVYSKGKYWWKIDYSNTETKSLEGDLCRVNGTSLVGHSEVLSSVEAEYHFDTITCQTSTPTPCQTAKALKMKSVEFCKYTEQNLTKPMTEYDFECVSNYIARTGDKSLCRIDANYGDLDCDNLVVVTQL